MKLIFFLLLLSITIYPQTQSSSNTNNKDNDKIVSEDELQHLETETDLKIKNLEDKIERDYRELNDKNDKLEDSLKERMNLYVAFVLGILGLIGFLINFFGKRIIAFIEEKGKIAIDNLIKELDIESKKILEDQNKRYDTLINELKIKKYPPEKGTTEEEDN